MCRAEGVYGRRCRQLSRSGSLSTPETNIVRLQKLPDILADPDLWDIGEQVGNPKGAKIMGDGRRRLAFASAEEAATAILALDGARIGLDGEVLGDSAISACQWSGALEADENDESQFCELCNMESDEAGEEGFKPRQFELGVYVIRPNSVILSYGDTPAAENVNAGFHWQGC